MHDLDRARPRVPRLVVASKEGLVLDRSESLVEGIVRFHVEPIIAKEVVYQRITFVSYDLAGSDGAEFV